MDMWSIKTLDDLRKCVKQTTAEAWIGHYPIEDFEVMHIRGRGNTGFIRSTVFTSFEDALEDVAKLMPRRLFQLKHEERILLRVHVAMPKPLIIQYQWQFIPSGETTVVHGPDVLYLQSEQGWED